MQTAYLAGKKSVLIMSLLLLVLGLTVVTESAAHHTVSDTWIWFWGCGSAPNATAQNGDQMLIGLGDQACDDVFLPNSVFTFHPKTIAREGPYTHTNAAGDVVSEGTWTAVRLISFVDYGEDPGGSPHGGALRMQLRFEDEATGAVKTGVVTIICTDFGKFQTGAPPTERPGPQQGITIHVGGQNFKGVYDNFTVKGYNFYIPI